MSAVPASSPYDNLIGRTLPGGWVVLEAVSRVPGGTGGTFSVCFKVRNVDGRLGFLKVLDYQGAVTSKDPVAALQRMTSDFQHEVASLEKCRDLSMRRVILAIDSSSLSDNTYPMALLSYIIFEPAIGDLRMVLPLLFAEADLALRFGILHDAVLGVRELHLANIAHQDLKPSNVLAVESSSSSTRPSGKIADLGRAIVAGLPHRFDGMPFPGDRGYAPPEYLYDFVPSGYDQRRRGADLYQIGSLMCFVLSGTTMSALVYSELPPLLRWDAWRGDFVDIEPSLQDATARAVERVVAGLPEWARVSVRVMLANLCDPDPERRNAMTKNLLNVSNFSLTRVVSALDRLQKQAVLKYGNAA